MKVVLHRVSLGRWLLWGMLLWLNGNACGQRFVAPCSHWLATVDENTQAIQLRWRPSPDTLAVGYHICTGDTCRQYALVHGRFDTTYVCADHSPLTPHLYRLHVFDSAGNTSTLTPPFGNMVLRAHTQECQSAVSVEWTPCVGLFSGVNAYELYARFVPLDSEYHLLTTADSTSTLQYTFDMPEGARRAELKVRATAHDTSMQSLSNIVVVEQSNADTLVPPSIDSIAIDSVHYHVALRLNGTIHAEHADCALWRSINGEAWLRLATLAQGQTAFVDADLNPYHDTLLCYRTAWTDACGNPLIPSASVCLTLPTPASPRVEAANILIADDETNGRWLPHVEGLIGDAYELTIYDRRGLRIFHTNNPIEAWMPSQHTPQGVYTYILHVKFADNSVETTAGTITVIK